MKLSLVFITVALLSSTCVADDQTAPSIATTGKATVFVKPDLVDLRFEVHAFNKDLARAKAEVDEASRAIVTFLEALSVDQNDIQTERMRANAVYDEQAAGYRTVRGELRGYTVGRSYVVVLRDISNFETISDKILADTKCSFGGYSYRTSQIREHMDTARANALTAAREKAVAMAGRLDCKIGVPIRIAESSHDWNFGGGNWSNYSGEAESRADDSTTGNVSLGQIEVTAEVKVTFELKSGG